MVARSFELTFHEGQRFSRLLRLFRFSAAGTFASPQWGGT